MGNGSSSREISVGFQPDMVIVKSVGTGYGVFRTSNMPANLSHSFVCAPTLFNGIRSLDPGGFTVGSNDNVNKGGANPLTYHWFAIKDSQLGTNIKFGAYFGNGGGSQQVTGVDFQPSWVFVKGDSGTCDQNCCSAIQRTAAMPANQSFEFGNAQIPAISDGIRSFSGDGFTVGGRGDVNADNTFFYYVAFKETASFKTGTYTGNGQPTQTVQTGLSPAFVSVIGDSINAAARWRASEVGFPDANSAAYAAFGDSADAIRQIVAGGFQVGMDDDVNAPVVPYYWVALSGKMPPGAVPADVEVDSVTVNAPDTATIGVPFVVLASAHHLNHGPAASVVVDGVFSPSWSPGCAATEGAKAYRTTVLYPNTGTSVGVAWSVTCSVGGLHLFTVIATAAINPAESWVDPNPANNTNSGSDSTQVN